MTASLSETLRAGTRSRHDALEATAFARALLSGTLPLERYVDQLAAYRLVLGALEDELSHATGPAVTAVWSAELVKLPLVERDLRYFAERGVSVRSYPRDEVDSFVAGIRHTAVADPDALLGFLYVLEGSTLGALVLQRHVCAAYGLTAPDGVAYYGCGDRGRWARFTARMNAAVTDPGVRVRIADAAECAYRHTLALTTALSAGLPRVGPSGPR